MKKLLLSFILLVTGLCTVGAEEPVKGIIATYEGSEVCYKLEDMPTVKHETVEGVQYALLYLKETAAPVLRVALADNKKLIVAYGEYVSEVADNIVSRTVTVTDKNGKKIINGGKLVIIDKNGKMYDTTGVEIKQ